MPRRGVVERSITGGHFVDQFDQVAAKIIVCRPADPEANGLVEHSHD